MRLRHTLATSCTAAAASLLLAACGGGSHQEQESASDPALIAKGQQIFRYDTFGDETQWTDTLRMHEVIRAAVDPVTALSVGLKVDSEALTAAVVQGIQDGSIDLESPDTTVALLKLDAVVGVKGTVESVGGKDTLTHVGITSALCLDGRQFVRAGDRQTSRWLAQPRSRSGRHHRVVTGASRRRQDRLQLLGPRQIRRSA